jgi:hypothetical protein
MKEQIKIKDYDQDVHILKTALNATGVNVDYYTTDLIHKTLKVLNKKKGQMDLHDIVTIKHEHEQHWDEYFKNLKDD